MLARVIQVTDYQLVEHGKFKPEDTSSTSGLDTFSLVKKNLNPYKSNLSSKQDIKKISLKSMNNNKKTPAQF